MITPKILDDNINKSDVNHVAADIIVLGCSLPGMVTAYKLKKTFGDTMEIVILDIVKRPKQYNDDDGEHSNICNVTARDIADNLTKYYLTTFAKLFKIRIPTSITEPEKLKSNLGKVFENEDGNIETYWNLHEFNFLNVFEKFELNQYRRALDESMKDLFQANKVCDAAERKKLRYLDRTNMEQDMCSSLLFPTTRNIMRNTVRLACGVSPDKVSVLFFLYQCYRTGGVTNNLDGKNTKLREKLLGYFMKHLSSKLYQGIFSIILPSTPIQEISLCSGEKVLLKTRQGDTNYVCDLLAMALKPDELPHIQFESAILSKSEKFFITSMTKGKSKKFCIQYKNYFWRSAGYSGDIFSIRGPILWATEKPILPPTGRKDLYPMLVGYLQYNIENSEESVTKQLIGIFGDEAAKPVRYTESDIDDIYVPLCGNFIPLRRFLGDSGENKIEWGALDVFAEGDVGGALEAGHNAYIHLLACLRPQAQSFEDLELSNWPTFFNDTSPFRRWFTRVNFVSSTRLMLYATAAYVGYRVVRRLYA